MEYKKIPSDVIYKSSLSNCQNRTNSTRINSSKTPNKTICKTSSKSKNTPKIKTKQNSNFPKYSANVIQATKLNPNRLKPEVEGLTHKILNSNKKFIDRKLKLNSNNGQGSFSNYKKQKGNFSLKMIFHDSADCHITKPKNNSIHSLKANSKESDSRYCSNKKNFNSNNLIIENNDQEVKFCFDDEVHENELSQRCKEYIQNSPDEGNFNSMGSLSNILEDIGYNIKSMHKANMPNRHRNKHQKIQIINNIINELSTLRNIMDKEDVQDVSEENEKPYENEAYIRPNPGNLQISQIKEYNSIGNSIIGNKERNSIKTMQNKKHAAKQTSSNPICIESYKSPSVIINETQTARKLDKNTHNPKPKFLSKNLSSPLLTKKYSDIVSKQGKFAKNDERIIYYFQDENFNEAGLEEDLVNLTNSKDIRNTSEKLRAESIRKQANKSDTISDLRTDCGAQSKNNSTSMRKIKSLVNSGSIQESVYCSANQSTPKHDINKRILFSDEKYKKIKD